MVCGGGVRVGVGVVAFGFWLVGPGWCSAVDGGGEGTRVVVRDRVAEHVVDFEAVALPTMRNLRGPPSNPTVDDTLRTRHHLHKDATSVTTEQIGVGGGVAYLTDMVRRRTREVLTGHPTDTHTFTVHWQWRSLQDGD